MAVGKPIYILHERFKPMPFRRSSGILLHPTSLPSRFGVGDLGPEAYRFVDFLAECSQHIWQVLPLGPTGYGDSPYMCFSAMAGNPLLLSPEILQENGWLDADDLSGFPSLPVIIDYGRLIPEKTRLLRTAWSKFNRRSTPADRADFEEFCHKAGNWVDDFSLFMALKDRHGGKAWVQWDRSLARPGYGVLRRVRRELGAEIQYHKFLQYEFHRQVHDLRAYANAFDIKLVGDLPIYVAHDSAEVWARPEYFQLDSKTGNPAAVAGVPPDYFSATGQLWGNPLYNWKRLEQENFGWWARRFKAILDYVDGVRIDHFRGFESYWSIPFGEATAINGEWVVAPGEKLFRSLRAALGNLPVIAEDLGIITPAVEALRDAFDLPGMKILQFAFGSGRDNPYLPHNFQQNCVVYTGTHDNDTTVGWYRSLGPEEQDEVCRYIEEYAGSSNPAGIHWDLIRLAHRSPARIAIVPLQDIIGLGSEARMNFPSRSWGNWIWRYRPEMLTDKIKEALVTLTRRSGRAPAEPATPDAGEFTPAVSRIGAEQNLL